MATTGKIGVTTENIFPVIKKFLYSDHEIFLRELVANAVDATQKMKALAASGEYNAELGELAVRILGRDLTDDDREQEPDGRADRPGELRRAHQASLTRQESLRNLAERYEGYGNSVKRVMEQRESVRGICGVVADLFHTERKYEISE